MRETVENSRRHAGQHPPAEPDAPRWVTLLAPYREPSFGRSLAELVVTVVPFVALWLLMLLSLRYSYWLCLLLAVPAAGFLVRLFMIQHDCGHGSFFRRRRANDWLGRVLGVLTLTPYGYWRRTHAMHHATSGHLGRRGTGDVVTLTVREYQSLLAWRRGLYRLSRHPIVVLGVGPFYLFVLQHRLPVRLMRGGRAPWVSVMSTNLAIAGVVGLLVAVLGVRDFLLVHAPISLLASSAGVWLFYVQHQFEHTYWRGARTGTFTPAPCTAARTTTCRPCCAGSRRTSASIMSIIWAAGSPATGSARCCASIPSCARSVASPSRRAFGA
jgi:acyl-lipid omega-6 desaturase (Delta-12 desaturase)